MRKKLKPDQDLNTIQSDLLEEIQATYEDCGSLKKTAKELELSITKVRKALITAQAYSNDTSEEVERLLEENKTVTEIAERLGVSESCIYSYIPYKVRAYGLTDDRGQVATTVDADRVKRYRNRRAAVQLLRECIERGQDWKENDGTDGTDGVLWKCITLYAGQKFKTAGRGRSHRGSVGFTYELKVSSRSGLPTDELVISSRENGKTITRSSVELALERMLEIQQREGYVKGPKAAGQIFGASYLYAVFLKWGVITDSPVSTSSLDAE